MSSPPPLDITEEEEIEGVVPTGTEDAQEDEEKDNVPFDPLRDGEEGLSVQTLHAHLRDGTEPPYVVVPFLSQVVIACGTYEQYYL